MDRHFSYYIFVKNCYVVLKKNEKEAGLPSKMIKFTVFGASNHNEANLILRQNVSMGQSYNQGLPNGSPRVSSFAVA